ncbi:MAG: guanitoxin biosynthesis L-enduracididine beta-hydroxylase GntD [Gloeotrichia echinulata DVL01]|jgi:Fe(II)/alpha-ketoglutarate-dependent arginine beta-hydroxylase|nr:TauD/TfdA family dioxygenase [Gloeotrichia echinulata DEX184]
MSKLVLNNQEVSDIQSLLKEITSRYNNVEDIEFLQEASLFAHELPWRVRKFINNFKLTEDMPGNVIISGYPIDDYKIGLTPNHWKWKADSSRTLDEQILLVLYGSLLGEVFGWSTQQDGYVVHDIFPIESHENEQLGCGSSQTLWWHNEDAFHPYRADYVIFLCLRNPDNVATTFGKLNVEQLKFEQIQMLFNSYFNIRPDESHLEKNESDLRKKNRETEADEMIKSAYEKINKMNSSSDNKISVLFGSPESPYLRLDPYFMDELKDNKEAQSAFDDLIRAIDRNIEPIVLQPGDYCLIDNFRVVHGRNPFRANYDGKDRWLKRINITKDLRKSRDSRATSTSRIIL